MIPCLTIVLYVNREVEEFLDRSLFFTDYFFVPQICLYFSCLGYRVFLFYQSVVMLTIRVLEEILIFT